MFVIDPQECEVSSRTVAAYPTLSRDRYHLILAGSLLITVEASIPPSIRWNETKFPPESATARFISQYEMQIVIEPAA